MRSVILFISLVVCVGIGWLVLRPAPFSSIDVMHPVRGPAVQAVYATGTVEATVMMPIAARNTARLMELNVDEGSAVKKDQVLAKLEDEDIRSALEQLRAQEAFAKKEYDRDAAQLKANAIAVTTYERAKSDWESAKAASAKAEAEEGYMKLIAPADGFVIRRDGEVGQLIPANQAVVWISCCAPLRISAEVDEEDIALVKPGQDVLIRADAFTGKVFHGRVQSITPKGDPVARSYRVRIAFAGDNPLQIGMTAETNIIAGERQDALLLPASAVQKDVVWLVRNGALVKQPVTVGAKGPEQVEIKSGVAQDDLVVLSPDAALEEGHAVQAKLKEQAR